jgi:DNA-binding CsgD family transcriptional regulator
LEQFIFYFKSKILPLIASVKKDSDILIPYELDEIRGPAHRKKRDLFFADTEVQYFYLRTNGKDIKLTKRQEECLALFALGKKMKEIGNILNLSEKTIEFYLRKIMKKTQLDTKSELLRSYVENRKITI